MFGNGKKTVAGITESLTKIRTDLQILEKEKKEELKIYEEEQKQLNLKISNAEDEKSKGWKIYNNISSLLGEPIDAQQDKKK